MIGLLERARVKSVAELAEMPAVRQCLQWFTREKLWINEQHLQISRIPAPTFFERERAEAVGSLLRELGSEVHLDGAGNVVARTTKAPEGPYVVLSAHLDTVLSPKNVGEIVVEPGGRLLGPGVADNGAGLAALLAIAGALYASPGLEDLHCGLVLLANVCEEGEGNLNGMRHFCEDSPLAENARAFLILDGPATDHITSSALESRRYEVTFQGAGGHSWSDFGIGNPAHALSRAVTHFLEQQDGTGSANPRCSYNFGVMESGASINAIPTLARTKVDLRSESRARIEELAASLAVSMEKGAELENAAAASGKVTSRVRLIGSRPGGRLSQRASILNFLKSVDAHLGIRAWQDCASTDANIPLSKGLQAVSIGAGGSGGGAHTPSEWFHPDGRDLGLKRILLTLCLLMRNAQLARGEE